MTNLHVKHCSMIKICFAAKQRQGAIPSCIPGSTFSYLELVRCQCHGDIASLASYFTFTGRESSWLWDGYKDRDSRERLGEGSMGHGEDRLLQNGCRWIL